MISQQRASVASLVTLDTAGQKHKQNMHKAVARFSFTLKMGDLEEDTRGQERYGFSPLCVPSEEVFRRSICMNVFSMNYLGLQLKSNFWLFFSFLCKVLAVGGARDTQMRTLTMRENLFHAPQPKPISVSKQNKSHAFYAKRTWMYLSWRR